MRRVPFIPLLVSAFLISVAFVSISPTATADLARQFMTVEVPNAAQTSLTGINAAGEVCGYYRSDPNGASHSFTRDPAGNITIFDVPGSIMNAALGINNHGQVVGYWSTDLNGTVEHMFLRDASGAIETLDVPNHVINVANGINDGGQMAVNALAEPGPSEPMFRTVNGAYVAISVPGFASAYVNGLNNNGVAAGCAYANGGPTQAYIVSANSPVEPVIFTVPDSTTATCANAVNDGNTAVGYYTTGYRGGEWFHAFIRQADGALDSFDVPGSRATLAFGINNEGTVVGSYDDSQWHVRGFIATELRHPETRPLRNSPSAPEPAVVVVELWQAIMVKYFAETSRWRSMI